jgi:predicted ATPase
MAQSPSAVHRTIVAVDVERFGDPRRTNPDQVVVRCGLYRALERAFGNAGIPWDRCQREDRGDGVLLLAPPELPKSPFAGSLPGGLASALREHNAARRAPEQIRLRMALHAGEVSYDEHGVTAAAINLTFRLLDAPQLRAALGSSPGVLALIASSWFFDEVIRHDAAVDPATYRPARISVKETTATAWIALPDHPYPPDAADREASLASPGGLAARPHPAPGTLAGTVAGGAVTALAPQGRKGNLPAEVTRFVGRRRELSQIGEALKRYRLVTLRGVGGVGKTRLALRVAAGVRRSFADGVWLAELSSLRDAGLLARTVATCLGLPDQAAGDPVDLLADHLAERDLLLVLDTCEHLADACAMLAQALLRAAPRLRILATSREPLGVIGERALLISPLAVPGAGAHAAGYESVAFFIDRADAMTPGFTMTTANEQAVAQLCRGLDGIPLALELAAIRLRAMSVEQIAARLDDRFRLLGTARTSQDRHQTLRAAVDWSHELCTVAEQRLWARLSVFPGGFDLEAAERVCAGDILAADSLFDVLGRLVEKSVVLCEQDGRRYRMLDTIREYGAGQLAALGEQHHLRRRHRDHYLGLAERAAAGSLGAGQAGWLAMLRQETPNLRVALDYSYTSPGQEAAGLRMTVLLRHYWLLVGQFSEGRRWHDRALAAGSNSPDGAWAVYGAGVLALQQGDLETGGPLLARAAGLAADLHDRDLAADVTDAQGIASFFAGDLDGARACHEKALAAYAEIGFREPFALICFARLASVCCLTGELDRALALSEECLRRSEELGEQWARGTALWIRGAARWLSADTGRAVEDALACLAIKEVLGDLHTITMAIDLLAVCRVAQGDYVRAAELSGAGDALWKILRAPVQQGPYYAEIRRNAAETCRRALGEAQFETARRRGTGLSFSEAIAIARNESATAATRTPTSQAGTSPGS